jgi:hypothetical protein
MFLITRAIDPPAVSPSGVCQFQEVGDVLVAPFAKPFWVMFGTQPRLRIGPPAKRLSAMMPPENCAGCGTRRNGRDCSRDTRRDSLRRARRVRRERLAVHEQQLQIPILRLILNGNGTSWSRTLPGTGASVFR